MPNMPNAVAAAMISFPGRGGTWSSATKTNTFLARKNKKDCPSGYRYDKEPSIKTVQTDRNQSAETPPSKPVCMGAGVRNLLLAAMVMQRRRIG